MAAGLFKVPVPSNEPVFDYAPGTEARRRLKEAIDALYAQPQDIPMVINGQEVRTGRTVDIYPPHNLHRKVGVYHQGDASHVKAAIEAAQNAKKEWAAMPWHERIAIFLRAAELLAGPYRYKINAATMIGQSKNPFQAEIDSACELIDFFRFNAYFAAKIYEDQPQSGPGMWNRNEYRPLDGFVLAVTPFNFTSIAGNLPSAPAMMGNTVVWKPSNKQIYSAIVIMEVLQKAGLPDGVINMVFAPGAEVGKVVFKHPDFAGLHFTGSTTVFQQMWQTIGENIAMYKAYPRIVGETGGKDFILVHPSADPDEVITAIIRGAFEYQGQKCSAASRAFIPKGFWNRIKDKLRSEMEQLRMGPPEDFRNFINAVIDKAAFDKLAGYLDHLKNDPKAEIFFGGGYDDSEGYFIEPTIAIVDSPYYVTMCEELFGPILSVYLYDDDKYEEILPVIDEAAPYGLTGAVMAHDRHAIMLAHKYLEGTAGNFYVNDKPTGAVVGQQPFGGSRASGTNDKAGSAVNLLRWTSIRTIKENFNPPKDWRYPFMEEA